ncbi:MFS transporter [Pseudonocardia endophytica]|uniref:Putative MFS family arabinose efflux permease n=1 Tax=Pseudonocardia endophytica TaxID=401976 RepID=A0A4R1HQD3_PSEEN|nr:MFS transporter [Pseudonocardia endophytica]TCK24794.1 putative MFS family arabinose efflux permease [Pseudonocardia endophytica]
MPPKTTTSELWTPSRRATTIGILLLISLIAFEAMGVGTAMPAVMADLGEVRAYAWPFVAFLASAVFGTALGGQWCDARGPRMALIAAPAAFGLGLIAAGTADTLAQLLVGRVLQGLGAGVQGVAVYVLVAAVYPERSRPAVFGLISSAWVVPSLAGPPLAGVVTELWSWHWVFLGLVPLVALALLLVLPAARAAGRPEGAAGERSPVLVPAAAGAAAGVAGLSWALEHVDVTGLVVGLVALAVLAPSLARLLPSGVLRLRRGVAAVVGARGLVAAAFFTVTAFLPLLLTSVHGWSLAAAGIPLIVGSLGWSAAAAWQGRRPDASRPRLLRAGFAMIAAAELALLPVAAGWLPGWLAVPLWAVAGTGMGLAFSSIAYLTLAHSSAGDVGSHSSSAQLLDQLANAAFTGVGGALLVLFAAATVALPVLLVVLAVLALAGAVTAGRTAVTAG